MRKIEEIALVAIIVFSFFSLNRVLAFAPSYFQPFGGRVLTTNIGGWCLGYGPFSIEPVNLAPPAFYTVPMYNPYFYTNPVLPGSYILGLYAPTPISGTCYTDSVPPVPYPALPVTIYGTSKL